MLIPFHSRRQSEANTVNSVRSSSAESSLFRGEDVDVGSLPTIWVVQLDKVMNLQKLRNG